MITPERYVLKQSLKILNTVYKSWVTVRRHQVAKFRDRYGNVIAINKTGESDIAGWVNRGHYIAKPLAIETKRSNFNPVRLYGDDLTRFLNQCEYLRDIQRQGGIAFWVNDPRMIHHILAPALFRGHRITLSPQNQVLTLPPLSPQEDEPLIPDDLILY